jgi:hypothetical protein
MLVLVLSSWTVCLSAAAFTLAWRGARVALAPYRAVFKGFVLRWLLIGGLIGLSIAAQLITTHTLPGFFVAAVALWLAPGLPLLLWANLRPSHGT